MFTDADTSEGGRGAEMIPEEKSANARPNISHESHRWGVCGGRGWGGLCLLNICLLNMNNVKGFI